MSKLMILFIILNLLFYIFIICFHIFPLFNLGKPINSSKKYFGKKIISFTKKKIMNKQNISLSLFTLPIMYICFTVHDNMLIKIIGFALQSLTLLFVVYKYSNSAGVYENGLIYGDFLTWDKIHSWKTESNGKISLLLKNGFNITIEEEIDTEALSKILEEKLGFSKG